MEQSFIAYIENSIKNNWDLDALTDYKGATLQYKGHSCISPWQYNHVIQRS